MPLIQYQQIAGTPSMPTGSDIPMAEWLPIMRGRPVRAARLRPGQHRYLSFDDPTTPALIHTQAGAAIVNQMIPKTVVIQYQSVTAPVKDAAAVLPLVPEVASFQPVVRGLPVRRPVNRAMFQWAQPHFGVEIRVPVMSWTDAQSMPPIRRRRRAMPSETFEPPFYAVQALEPGWGLLLAMNRNRLVH